MESVIAGEYGKLASMFFDAGGENEVLQALEQKTSSMGIEGADLFIFSPDLDGFFFPDGTEGVGVKARQVLSDRALDLEPSEDGTAFQKALDEKAGAGYRVEPLVRSEKIPGFLVLKTGPSGVDSDSVKLLAVFAGGALDRLALAREIQKLKLQAEAISQEMIKDENHKLLGRMLGGITHDFNNILTGVSGFAQLIQMMDEDPETQDSVNEILTASEGGKKIISFLSRVKKVRLDENPASGNIKNHINDAVLGLKGLVAQLHPGKAGEVIPPADGPDVQVKAAPDLCVSLFSHLLSALLENGARSITFRVYEKDSSPVVDVNFAHDSCSGSFTEHPVGFAAFRLLSQAMAVDYSLGEGGITLAFKEKSGEPEKMSKFPAGRRILVFESDMQLSSLYRKYFSLSRCEIHLIQDVGDLKKTLCDDGPFDLAIIDDTGLDAFSGIPVVPPVLCTCSFGQFVNMEKVLKAPVKSLLIKPFTLTDLEKAAMGLFETEIRNSVK